MDRFVKLALSNSQSLTRFLQWLSRLGILTAAFLLVMSAFRLAATLIYGQKETWGVDLLKAFVMGLRFDAAVLGYICAFPVLFLISALLLKSNRIYQWFSRFGPSYFSFFLSLIALLLAVDTKYYSYFQDHFNILVFALVEDDTKALLLTFWKNYPVIWYLIAASLGLWFLHKLVVRILKQPEPSASEEKIPWVLLPLVALLSLVCVFFVGRGSFGLFPLGPADTVISRDPFINHLSTNGIHALFRAFKLRKQQITDWDINLKNFGYSDPKQAFADFYHLPIDQIPQSPLSLFHQKTAHNPWAVKNRPHVVVIMMESFGTYWLQFNSPGFNLLGDLEKHLKEDIFLKNFLPSSSSTTGSLSSIMISAPQRPVGSFLTESQYLQVPFRSSPARVFSRAGYETHFIYGGNPGWRDMNKFARFQGFDHVEGDVDMQAKLGKFKEVHDWGVYDEDLFRYVKTLLSEATKPQMLLVMTTTNHPPYQIPSSYHPPEQKIPSELAQRMVAEPAIVKNRFQTYLYSSQKLAEFLNEVKSSALGEKTLVAVTGDHNFWLINFNDEEIFQKWSVPFYLYAPKALKLKLDPETFASHVDIFPTLYNLSLSDTEYDALGVDILDPQASHYAFHSSGLAVGPAGGSLLLGKSGSSYFDWQGHFQKLIPAQENEAKKAMALRYKSLMSLLDYYFMSEKKGEQK
jgi:phosphoglycerol transferase MdoB-like AlkP superfamily enzyme